MAKNSLPTGEFPDDIGERLIKSLGIEGDEPIVRSTPKPKGALSEPENSSGDPALKNIPVRVEDRVHYVPDATYQTVTPLTSHLAPSRTAVANPTPQVSYEHVMKLLKRHKLDQIQSPPDVEPKLPKEFEGVNISVQYWKEVVEAFRIFENQADPNTKCGLFIIEVKEGTDIDGTMESVIFVPDVEGIEFDEESGTAKFSASAHTLPSFNVIGENIIVENTDPSDRRYILNDYLCLPILVSYSDDSIKKGALMPDLLRILLSARTSFSRPYYYINQEPGLKQNDNIDLNRIKFLPEKLTASLKKQDNVKAREYGIKTFQYIAEVVKMMTAKVEKVAS